MKKGNKINTKKVNDHKKLIYLLSEYSPLERQNFLREIDQMILDFFKINESELPWLNSHKKSEKKWEKLTRRVRLILSKIRHEKNFHENRILN